MTRSICVVTGSRAEYGLLKGVLEAIRVMPGLRLQIIATGMHLAPEFGLTYREIEADGFTIDRRVPMLQDSDTPAAIAKSMGAGLMGFGEALEQLQPDLVVVLGDRFEILSVVSAALVARIPVAHIHGGEVTQGAVDEAIRHAVTKMSHLHFVAAEPYRQRVVQLGEDPDLVFMVGGLGVDNIKRLTLLDRPELEAALGFALGPRNLLVTFHPATAEHDTSAVQMNELLHALETLDETHIIFTFPNADNGGRVMIPMIEAFVTRRPRAIAFASLGQLRYLSCLRWVDGIVGNSSSGLTEAPSFKIGTVDIGDRQRGRLKALSVIECAPEQGAIVSALERLYSPGFQASLSCVSNPYGDGGASQRIVDTLAAISLDGIIKKRFHDFPVRSS